MRSEDISKDAAGKELVILLHGLWRRPRSMRRLARALERMGYETLTIGYPSHSRTLHELVAWVHARLQQEGVSRAPRIHFIGHSLGTRIILALLAAHAYPNCGRIVLLAPPLQGSKVARRLARNFVARMAFGPVLHDLSHPIDKKEAEVIAASDVLVVRAQYDILVRAEEATHAALRQSVSLPCSHTFIMRDRATIEKIISFLKSDEVG